MNNPPTQTNTELTQLELDDNAIGICQDNVTIGDYFADRSSVNDIKIPLCHGGYKLYYNIRRFFYSPLRSVTPKEDLNLISQVGILLQTEQSSNKETIDKCAQLISLHRHMENTSARKRLERWAKYVISTYLFVVLLVLLLNGGIFSSWGVSITIESQVMIVLLSTTTINVIGLGLIVLRGHFSEKELLSKEKVENEQAS